SRVLDLGRINKERTSGTQALSFHVTSNIGTVYRIFQQLSEPLVSAQGETLDEKTLVCTGTGSSQGSFASASGSSVSVSKNLLYTSNEWGASDAFAVQYVFAPSPTQKAGLYHGMLSFYVESTSSFVSQEVIHVPVSVEIESIFSLDVAFENGKELSF